MPAYNEEGGIASAVAEVQRELLDAAAPAHLVVVDDGSTDRTGQILDGLAEADPRIRVVHQRNGGHGAALLTALDHATGEWIFAIDSDQQIPLAEFGRLWQAASGHDVVLGVRIRRRDPVARRALTGLVRVMLPALLGVRLRDANAPCKLFRRSAWEQARPFIPRGTLAPSLFFAVHAVRAGLRVTEVEVAHRARATGVTSLRYVRLLRFCFRAFGQLVRFRHRPGDDGPPAHRR